MNTGNTSSPETRTEGMSDRGELPLEDPPSVQDCASRAGTAGTGTTQFMTGRRPPGRDSTRVGFPLFVAAFVIDMLLHIAVSALVWYAMWRSPDAAVSPIVTGMAAGIAASFLHRTLLQRLFRTTTGKAVFGLQLRQADGTYPTLRRLVEQWFQGALATIGAPLQLLG
ncbi:RDD family protein [Nocardia sp. NPDC004573]